ncbi:MAG TPA: L-threonine 3-dehydrogenase [Gaiellaceae bacterium]|nr:L-threonine 3-dehydrogenase [Gaiellaceae bacterium]
MWAIRKLRAEPGLVLDEVPVPRIGDDDVLVKVEAASLCGTDLHIFHWDEWARHRIRPPLTLGHEFAGTVVTVGRNVRHTAPGDYVSAESHVTCGMCFECRTGQAHMCERTQILGVDRDGAFAEYVAVPESVIWLNDRTKLPPEIATLQEPFGNAVFATGLHDLAGRTVAVLGCGPVGLFSIAVARASGAGRVLASDRIPFRTDLARKMGVSDVVDVDAVEDVPGWFLERNEGEHLDVVLEMSGAPSAIDQAFRIVRNGGHVVLFGIPARPVELDIAESLIFKNLSVTAVNGRRIFETWYKTRWLLEHGVVDLEPLITHRCALSDFDRALGELDAGLACKVVFFPGRGAEAAAEAEPAERREPAAQVRELAPWAHR